MEINNFFVKKYNVIKYSVHILCFSCGTNQLCSVKTLVKCSARNKVPSYS